MSDRVERPGSHGDMKRPPGTLGGKRVALARRGGTRLGGLSQGAPPLAAEPPVQG